MILMAYILCFMGGGLFGALIMCLFIVGRGGSDDK